MQVTSTTNAPQAATSNRAAAVALSQAARGKKAGGDAATIYALFMLVLMFVSFTVNFSRRG